MNDDFRLLVGLILLLALIFVAARRPEMLLAFAGRATARCRDGSWSFSRSRCGTCSHHGGVAQFIPA